LHRSGIAPLARDIPGFHAMLYERGLAVPLGQPFQLQPVPASDGLGLAASRIRMLFERASSAGHEEKGAMAPVPDREQRRTLAF
jgi:hypothetical protein